MKQDDHPIGILRAQLHRPPPSRHAIPRPALLQRLDLALEGRLTLVSAPAGYGKTTLVSQWLDSIPLPAAWLSLDERDDSLRMFLSCFVAAIHTLFPNVCEGTERLLQALLLAPLDYLTVSLINELEQVTQPFVLVIDDYHLIHDPDVHRLMDEVLRHTLPCLHLVLVTRFDPPLALHRLAAQGHLVSLRAADLRFRPDEAASALEHWLGRRPSNQAVKTVLDQTEGWVAGLWLTNLWLQEAPDVDQALTSISASTPRSVIAYLDGEVFQQLPTDVQHFVLRTSILDSFSADLCDAILDEASQLSDAKRHAPDMLTRLENANLFITPLDHTHDWFRYHHLFRDWLRRRLRDAAAPDEIAALHRRAASWWDKYGEVDQAIAHALAAGDGDLAADLVERHRRRALNSDRWQDLKRWLTLLPAALVQQRPALLVAQAWGFHFALNFGAIRPILADAAALLESQASSPADGGDKILRAEMAALQAEMLYFAGDAEAALPLLQSALADLPADDGFARGVAVTLFALTAYSLGRVDEAVDFAMRISQNPRQLEGVRARALFGLNAVLRANGRFRELERWAQHQIAFCSRPGFELSLCWGHYLAGCACYERNDLERAVEHLNAVRDRRYLAPRLCLRESLYALSVVYSAQGRHADAVRALAEMEPLFSEAGLLASAEMESYLARLAMLTGDAVAALRHADAIAGDNLGRPMILFETPPMTRATVYIALGTTSQKQEAIRLLEELERRTRATQTNRHLTRCLGLHAIALHDAGQEEQASAVLEQAVRLAYDGGLIRSLVDLGPQMYSLLAGLADREAAPIYVHRILAAFASHDGDATPPARIQPGAIVSRAATSSMREAAIDNTSMERDEIIEELSPREMEVLRLLAERLTNKEIAARLFIETSTAKRHIFNICHKLYVSRRQDAVWRARMLGLLD